MAKVACMMMMGRDCVFSILLLPPSRMANRIRDPPASEKAMGVVLKAHLKPSSKIGPGAVSLSGELLRLFTIGSQCVHSVCCVGVSVCV